MISKELIISLSEKQKILDNFICESKGFEVNEDILDKKVVAFFVELGEYANEERIFKYWSNKKETELPIQLDEYIDGLHFILSIGNQISFDFKNFSYNNKNFENNIATYFAILESLSNFVKDKNQTNFSELLNSFLQIIDVKKYTEEQILEAYNIKNEINFKRQENNY